MARISTSVSDIKEIRELKEKINTMNKKIDDLEKKIDDLIDYVHAELIPNLKESLK